MFFFKHEPIHVHGRFQNTESKAELIFEDGEFKEIRISRVKGKLPLDVRNERKLKKLVEVYRKDIVEKWVDFFIYNKEVKAEKITEKLK